METVQRPETSALDTPLEGGRGGRPHLNDNSSARGPNSSRGTNVESGSTGVVHLLTADFKWLVCGP